MFVCPYVRLCTFYLLTAGFCDTGNPITITAWSSGGDPGLWISLQYFNFAPVSVFSSVLSIYEEHQKLLKELGGKKRGAENG